MEYGKRLEIVKRPEIRDSTEARAELTRQCAEHGKQSEIARRCGVPAPYINRIIKAGLLPSIALRAALERECGIPIAAWNVTRWTWRMASDVLRGQRAFQPFDGYLATRLGIPPEFVDQMIEGTCEMPDEVRRVCEAAWGIPIGAWDVEHPSGGPARAV